MKAFEMKRYFALALDPIHVGTGGYRIGRVDNIIVREPATGIPKIPGTTIEGVCRSYAFLSIMENEKLVDKLKKEIGFNVQCAKGKVKKEGDKKIEPCGICPICITFGYTKDTEKEIEIEENGVKKKKRIPKSLQAMALFSDARILLFPVATMIGPVWVTCPMVLKDAGVDVPNHPKNNEFNEFVASKSLENILPERDGKKILNFGWLLLKGGVEEINLPISGIPDEILSRIVIVPDNLFPTIVNSNLEVRTSVAIDPERGAAEEGALFTYEAIPRGTVFWFEITYQNPKYFGLNDWETDLIIKTVEDGLRYFEYLGVGGMGSRGFGRLKVFGEFLSFEKYLNALERRLETLQKESKKEEIERIYEYLRGVKSKMEKDVKDIQSLIAKINNIIEKFCGDVK